MNKFLLLGVAAAMTAASASAFDIVPADITSKTAAEGNMAVKSEVPVLQTPATRAGLTAQDIEGDYEFTYTSYLQGASGTFVKDVTLTAVSDDQVELTGVVGDYPIVASVASDGTVTFNRQFLFKHAKGDVYFVHEVWNYNYSSIEASDEPLVGKYYNGKITFFEDDLFTVQIPGVGYIMMGDSLSLDVKKVDTLEWEEAGTAELMDCWINVAFGIDPSLPENIVIVPVEKAKGSEGIYRLVDPFKEGHPTWEKGSNLSEEPGYIQFNVETPDFPYLYTGIKAGYKDLSMGDFYCYDYNGFLLTLYTFGEAIDKLDTFDNAKLSTWNAETKTLDIPNGMFGYTSDKDGGYVWTDQEGTPLDMHARIVIANGSGISGVEADQSTTVEYYNLQGVRIANPSAGIYIRRCGRDVRKVNIIR